MDPGAHTPSIGIELQMLIGEISVSEQLGTIYFIRIDQKRVLRCSNNVFMKLYVVIYSCWSENHLQ